MSRWMLCGLLLVATIAVWGAPPAGLNNPGFEMPTATGQAAGWSRYVSPFGHASLALDRDVRRSGAASLRVDLADKSRCAVSQLISVAQPGAYTFSAEVRLAAPSAVGVQLQVEWFRAVDWPRRIQIVRSEPPSPFASEAADWTEIAATGTRPAEADLALVSIIAGDRKTPGGTVWIDEARWRPGAYPSPLVASPGFEQDANSDGQPDGWDPAIYGGGFTLTRDTTVAHSGQASARLVGAPDHGDRSCYYQATPIFSPPGKLRLSYWYKGTGLSAVVLHLLTPAGVQKPGGGIGYGEINETPPLSDQWQQFIRDISVPAAAQEAGIMRLDLILYQKGEGTLWYDEVKVELLD
jgi:hypothetical protein